MSSIINILLSFMKKNDYETIKRSESPEKIPIINKMIENYTKELSPEELVNTTKDLYEQSLIELSNINKQMETLEKQLQVFIESNNLSIEYYYKKKELKDLEVLYKEKELDCYDKKEDYLHACKNHFL